MWGQVIALAPSASSWLAEAEQIATSGLALRSYAVTGALVVLALSFWIANDQRAEIIDWRPERGRKPTTQAGIKKRQDRLDEFTRRARGTLLLRLMAVVVFGFVIPSMVLGVALLSYSWLLPGKHALAVAGDGAGRIAMLSLPDTALFVLSQLTMGVSGIAGEITSRSLTTYASSYVPADGLAAAGLAAYRYFVGAFVFVFVRLSVIAFDVSRGSSLAKVKKELEDAMTAARHRDSIGYGIVRS